MVNQQVQRVRLGYFMRRLLLAPLIFTLLSPIGLMAHEDESEDFLKIIPEIKECTDKGNCTDQESLDIPVDLLCIRFVMMVG